MYIEKCTNNGTSYLRLVESYRAPNSKGVKVAKKKLILNIGPLSKFDDGKPDYVQRLKESFKNGCPLISSLLPYCEKKQPLEKYKLEYTEGDPYLIGSPKLYSHCLLERIIEELGLVDMFRGYKSIYNIEFDLLGFVRLLIYGRILNPASKIATVNQNDDYYTPIITNPYEYNVYDTLDFIYKYKKTIFNKLNKAMISKFNRKSDLVFYDVTNFYFETEDPDDEDGVRQMGVSKENRKSPIVQMGMFMDENGFPISIEMFKGNTLDHQTVTAALKSSVDEMNFKRFIFIGDRGMTNYPNLLHITSLGNGYIVSKSILKSTKKDKEWLTNPEGYNKLSDDFKYKSRIIHKKIKDEFGSEHEITEKEVVYWSKKFEDRQKHENKSFLEFIEKLKKSPENFRISKSQSKDLKKFLKKDVENIDTGEVLDSTKLKALLDEEKLNAFNSLMGYYKIVTSELKMPDTEVIDKYHGLSQIEDQFRIMKGNLDTRPIFVRTPEHINAHLIICFISLLVLRIIQYKIKQIDGFVVDNDKNWQEGMTAEKIINALNKWTIDKMNDEYYRFNNINDPDLAIILKAFNINIPAKLYKRAELRNIKVNIKI
ncbi:MAG: IS1634 family transposase [Bacilli bacterium]|nr:IS1634 family transposase [Bacilli bacterium]